MVYLALVFLIIFIDQYTKNIAVRNLKVEEIKASRFSKLIWWHKKNYGIAYSSFSKYPDLIKLVTAVLTVFGYVLFLLTLPLKGFRLFKMSFAMALGGASGNLIDRVRNNCVTDFIYIKCKNAPIFNLADLFIVIGSLTAFIAALRIKD